MSMISNDYPLLTTAYFPPVAWWAVAWNHSSVALEACENFQKGSFRNRCHIATANGIQRLSLPLEKGKHQQIPIRDVRLSYETAWPTAHWRAIQTAYGNAPFFEFYEEDLINIFEKKFLFLFDLNLEIIFWIKEKLGSTVNFELTTSFYPNKEAGNLDFRKDSVEPNSLPHWFFPYPYTQVFSDRLSFLPNLSTLDLLFCRGKTSDEIFYESFVSI